jgi:hypothetical protein
MLKITIELKKSNALAILLLAIHLLALISCWLLFSGFFVKIFLLMGCLFSFVTAFSCYAWLLSINSIVKLWQEDDNVWYLQKKSGLITTATLQRDSYITSNFLLLNFATVPRRNVRVPIFADALNAHDLRRLRVLLLTQ